MTVLTNIGRSSSIARVKGLSLKALRLLVRVPGVQSIWGRLGLGSVETRMRFDITDRPHYAYGVYSAAVLAKRLGLPAFSVIELGVAGGRGLVALERLAAEIGAAVGVQIAVFGFDSGAGMPPPRDYRDLPHVWAEGFYKMDVDALKQRLSSAELCLGDVEKTAPAFVAAKHPPIGFVSFDLDYYSSTVAAFGLFEGPAESRLPRVYCYFDDISGPEIAVMNPYVGELLAIDEFNAAHPKKKISPILHLSTEREKPAMWNAKIYALHDFDHPLYTRNVMPQGDEFRQLPLS
jgi:hypothetical protein